MVSFPHAINTFEMTHFSVYRRTLIYFTVPSCETSGFFPMRCCYKYRGHQRLLGKYPSSHAAPGPDSRHQIHSWNQHIFTGWRCRPGPGLLGPREGFQSLSTIPHSFAEMLFDFASPNGALASVPAAGPALSTITSKESWR